MAKKLSLPYVHAPFVQGTCDRCHVSSDAPGLKAAQVELCYRCHSALKRNVTGRPYAHGPVKDGHCASCHAPHASKNKHLLKATGKKLCAGCHPDAMKKLSATYAHSPSAQGQCVTCHDAHSSEEKSLLVSGSIAVCESCHETQGKFTHPVGEDATDPRTQQAMTCVSCHEAHGSEYEFVLLKDRQRDLCTDCHRM